MFINHVLTCGWAPVHFHRHVDSGCSMFLLLFLLFGSLVVVFTPVAHLSPPLLSLAVVCIIIVDPGLDRSSMLFLCCASAEVRWTGLGETNMDEGHNIWHCREDSKHPYGMAITVQKEVEGSSSCCTPTYSRLISIRILTRPHNTTVNFRPWRRGGQIVLRAAW